jgi:hypothetical protein
MKSRPAIRARQSERGYALLLVAFVATLMLIAAMTAAPDILTYGKREREKEMIWRGNQYIRGIKMYYRKTGKFPTSLEDLTKPQMGNIHFMRQAYKDPMNKEDGSWRLIYVGPNGQLIGSLKPQPALTMPSAIPGTSQAGTPAGNMGSFGTSGPSMNGPNSMNGQIGGIQNTGPVPSGGGDASGAVATDTDAAGNPAQMSAQPTTIMGGSIIGVGSKINGQSVIVYDRAKNYRMFEFYWDPSKDNIGVGPQQAIPGTSTPGTPAGGPGTFGNPGTGGMNPQGGQNPPGVDPNNPPQN